MIDLAEFNRRKAARRLLASFAEHLTDDEARAVFEQMTIQAESDYAMLPALLVAQTTLIH